MIRRLVPWVAALVIFWALVWALTDLPTPAPGLVEEAYAKLASSGVSNPVTAVLLNYRSYDTLLEVAVLLLAVVAVWSLQQAGSVGSQRSGGPLLGPFMRFLLPLLVMVGCYLLWVGSFAPGGAFQGGAMLGGVVVLGILVGGTGPADETRQTWLRVGLCAGLVVFLVIGLTLALAGSGFLTYPSERAKVLILMIEAAATMSIGLTLGMLFLGGRPASASRNSEGR